MDELLTTRQVALELQVSESSVKRWCDQGVIRTRRTAGGHRRIERSGLNEFVAQNAAKGVQLTGRPDGKTEPTAMDAPPARVAEASEAYRAMPSREQYVERFQHALLAGDESAAQTVVDQWSKHYRGFALLGDGLISATLERIGREWECGGAEVFQERRSCEICMRLIHGLRLKLPAAGARAPRAIGGTLAGDHYALASQLVELVLRESGWSATNLGTNLPYETLLAAVRQERPRLLWLSISYIADCDQFVERYNRFYSQLPTDLLVAVGGRALTDDLRPRIGYTAHCDNLEKLSALAQVISGVR